MTQGPGPAWVFSLCGTRLPIFCTKTANIIIIYNSLRTKVKTQINSLDMPFFWLIINISVKMV